MAASETVGDLEFKGSDPLNHRGRASPAPPPLGNPGARGVVRATKQASVTRVLRQLRVSLNLVRRNREQHAIRLALLLEPSRFRKVTKANQVLTTLRLARELEQPLSQDVVVRDSGKRLRRV